MKYNDIKGYNMMTKLSYNREYSTHQVTKYYSSTLQIQNLNSEIKRFAYYSLHLLGHCERILIFKKMRCIITRHSQLSGNQPDITNILIHMGNLCHMEKARPLDIQWTGNLSRVLLLCWWMAEHTGTITVFLFLINCF